MLRWAVVFLVIAVIAALFGLWGVAGLAQNIAWFLFVVFLILFVVSLIFGYRVQTLAVALPRLEDSGRTAPE